MFFDDHIFNVGHRVSPEAHRQREESGDAIYIRSEL